MPQAIQSPMFLIPFQGGPWDGGTIDSEVIPASGQELTFKFNDDFNALYEYNGKALIYIGAMKIEKPVKRKRGNHGS